jgi:C4-dicarboxylate transporter, DctM subunit
VAAAYAFLISITLYRDVSAGQAYAAVLASARSTASIGILIAGALVFNYVVTVENIPGALRTLLAGYDLSPVVFLLIVNLTLLVLGCVLEGITILLIIVPIFIPAAQALGIDMVHFGVVVVVNIMIGLITPPYGLLLFIVANITKAPLWSIIREILPFLLAMLAALAVITFVPDIVLWLPRLMGYRG